MPFRTLITVLGMGLTLTACADLFTIGRITEIPNKGDSNTARAIHLDAQQRLVIATAEGYCAEPSPDAIASYAASLGFDLDIFSQGSSSLAQALNNDAASIGLRTQSITLMRDALYRMCEASNNGHLNETEVVAFLRRSQDLTAVVLAIEQLTGAVAAKQALLPPSAEPGALGNLVSNHQLLDQMEKDVKQKEKDVEEKKKVVKEKKTAVNGAQSKLDQSTDSKRQEAERTFSKAEEQVKTSEEDLKTAKKRLKKAEEVRDTIKTLRDAALTSATAETAGTGKFSPVVQRNQLSDEATKSVATAVENMVKHVLDKPYTSDVCLSHLISSMKDIKEKEKQVSELEDKLKTKYGDAAKAAIESIQTMQLQILNNGIKNPRIQDIEKLQDSEILTLTIQAKEAIQAIMEINEINAICKDILKKHSKKQ